METKTHIIHELPAPQSVQDLRAACGLPAVTVRHGDEVHQFAYTTQPEYVTCVGCLAVRELAAAREALGAGWLHDGAPLAEGIARKTRALERSIEDQARLLERVDVLLDAVVNTHRDDIPPHIRDMALAVMASPTQPDEYPGEPEAGTLIARCSCPCCGACLEVEHGDEPGQVAVLGTLPPADPMRPTVAVPRDLVAAIVDDVRQGLAVESETADELAALLGGGA